MLDIVCDECGKKYRVDETKMKGARAKVKCKACSNIMVINKPERETVEEVTPAAENYQPEETATIPEPPPPKTESVPQSVIDRPADSPKDKPAAADKEVSAVLDSPKIRFGLFGKIIIVMLIVSLLPFAVFWGLMRIQISFAIHRSNNLKSHTLNEAELTE